MRRLPATALVLSAITVFVLAGCGGSSSPAPTVTDQRTPDPAPSVQLTQEDKQVWARLPPARSAIPVLLYHGIGPEGDFSDSADADYGIGEDDFATQMTLMHHAGYRTVSLETFRAFVRGDAVKLPPRPLLLTFDDARADSWTGGDGILKKLGYTAVMFVDVGRVDGGNPEYLTWGELQTAQDSGRWELQLHSGKGHVQIHYGPGKDDYGPSYAYRYEDESLDKWRERTRSDIEWGQATLAKHISAYGPLAFAPPYGNYGQDGSNDDRIAPDLLGYLTDRYETVFTQDRNARAKPDGGPVFGRIQVTRAVTGGEVYDALLSGSL